MSWRIPSYIVPYENIDTNEFSLTKNNPIKMTDDWGRFHFSGSLDVGNIEYHEFVNSWSYFHSMLSDSVLPLYSVHSKGLPSESFSFDEFDMQANSGIVPREILFNPDDVMPAVFLDNEDSPVVNYTSLYKAFTLKEEVYHNSVKTYYLAKDINFHKRLRSIDTSYWQVVMYISCLEYLLPPPIYCKGKCIECDKGIKHITNDVNSEWDELVFNQILDKKTRKSYRLILDVARWKIRNDTVHNGIMPKTQHSPGTMSDGITIFTTEKAIKGYLSDRYSLETLTDQLDQICRNILINELIEEHVYPELRGLEIHSKTIKNITTNKATLEFDF